MHALKIPMHDALKNSMHALIIEMPALKIPMHALKSLKLMLSPAVTYIELYYKRKQIYLFVFF